jgi:hypothetical protein
MPDDLRELPMPMPCGASPALPVPPVFPPTSPPERGPRDRSLPNAAARARRPQVSPSPPAHLARQRRREIKLMHILRIKPRFGFD